MPKGLARILIALSVALLVPLQGLAAAQGDLCMGVEHHHSHDAHGDHHQGGDDGGQPSAHCPPCVACCAAAAISPSAAVLIPDAAADRQIATSPPLLSGIQPGILDRPPLAL